MTFITTDFYDFSKLHDKTEHLRTCGFLCPSAKLISACLRKASFARFRTTSLPFSLQQRELACSIDLKKLTMPASNLHSLRDKISDSVVSLFWIQTVRNDAVKPNPYVCRSFTS
jgi:hypothetical protein